MEGTCQPSVGIGQHATKGTRIIRKSRRLTETTACGDDVVGGVLTGLLGEGPWNPQEVGGQASRASVGWGEGLLEPRSCPARLPLSQAWTRRPPGDGPAAYAGARPGRWRLPVSSCVSRHVGDPFPRGRRRAACDSWDGPLDKEFSPLSWFPWDSFTNSHKRGGLKQWTWTLPQFWRPGFQLGFQPWWGRTPWGLGGQPSFPVQLQVLQPPWCVATPPQDQCPCVSGCWTSSLLS